MDRKQYHIYRIESPSGRAYIGLKERCKIDRVKQGRAASEGLKKYWADLKADPIRYAQVINSRKEKRKGMK